MHSELSKWRCPSRKRRKTAEKPALFSLEETIQWKVAHLDGIAFPKKSVPDRNTTSCWTNFFKVKGRCFNTTGMLQVHCAFWKIIEAALSKKQRLSALQSPYTKREGARIFRGDVAKQRRNHANWCMKNAKPCKITLPQIYPPMLPALFIRNDFFGGIYFFDQLFQAIVFLDHDLWTS